MKYYAGIDAGQSGTAAVIGDENGRVLGRGDAGPADEIGQDAYSTRMRDALRAAYENAARAAGLEPNVRCERIVAGVSGYEGRVYGHPPDLPCAQLELVHDAIVAHAGALDGKPGVIVIAGTGSAAYARNERAQTATIGGWGYLFGDAGGAFWIVREAISAAMADEDQGEPNALGALALAHFRKPTLHALGRSFYAGEIDRRAFAAFAPAILRSPAGANLVGKAAGALCLLAQQAMAKTQMDKADVAFVGGLMRSPELHKTIATELATVAPGAHFVEPRRDAAEGALILARR